jgi:hypothetical protein
MIGFFDKLSAGKDRARAAYTLTGQDRQAP